MDNGDLVLDAEAAALLGFRLSWPGEARGRAAPVPPLHGWPVALSAPSTETSKSWLPSVKLTGTPLG